MAVDGSKTFRHFGCMHPKSKCANVPAASSHVIMCVILDCRNKWTAEHSKRRKKYNIYFLTTTTADIRARNEYLLFSFTKIDKHGLCDGVMISIFGHIIPTANSIAIYILWLNRVSSESHSLCLTPLRSMNPFGFHRKCIEHMRQMLRCQLCYFECCAILIPLHPVQAYSIFKSNLIWPIKWCKYLSACFFGIFEHQHPPSLRAWVCMHSTSYTMCWNSTKRNETNGEEERNSSCRIGVNWLLNIQCIRNEIKFSTFRCICFVYWFDLSF